MAPIDNISQITYHMASHYELTTAGFINNAISVELLILKPTRKIVQRIITGKSACIYLHIIWMMIGSIPFCKQSLGQFVIFHN